ncbi:MAG: hypothetical protein PHF86_13090 [Candidatus Nanoarchaeia archaeon]|jgi:hypothetical protein|nr:hypothetical protein [Candidatus Nanoarchaeia archaeon]
MDRKRKRKVNEKERLQNIFAFWVLNIIYEYPYSRYESYTVRDFFEEFGLLKNSKCIRLYDYHALDHYGKKGLTIKTKKRKEQSLGKKKRIEEIKKRLKEEKMNIWSMLRNR